jgi:hypothetical protein
MAGMPGFAGMQAGNPGMMFPYAMPAQMGMTSEQAQAFMAAMQFQMQGGMQGMYQQQQQQVDAFQQFQQFQQQQQQQQHQHQHMQQQHQQALLNAYQMAAMAAQQGTMVTQHPPTNDSAPPATTGSS